MVVVRGCGCGRRGGWEGRKEGRERVRRDGRKEGMGGRKGEKVEKEGREGSESGRKAENEASQERRRKRKEGGKGRKEGGQGSEVGGKEKKGVRKEGGKGRKGRKKVCMHVRIYTPREQAKQVSQSIVPAFKKKEVGWMNGLNNIHRRLVS